MATREDNAVVIVILELTIDLAVSDSTEAPSQVPHRLIFFAVERSAQSTLTASSLKL